MFVTRVYIFTGQNRLNKFMKVMYNVHGDLVGI